MSEIKGYNPWSKGINRGVWINIEQNYSGFFYLWGELSLGDSFKSYQSSQ